MTTTTIAVLLLVQGILVAMINSYLAAKMAESVKNDYAEQLERLKQGIQRELEDYKAHHKRMEQAGEIAKILAHRSGGGEYTIKANEMIWAASLWLPGPLVHELSECLVNADKKDPRELLVSIRKVIHGANDPVTSDQISFSVRG
jgi:hypothetical protein